MTILWLIIRFVIVVNAAVVDTWKRQMCEIGREFRLVVEEDVDDVVEVRVFAQVEQVVHVGVAEQLLHLLDGRARPRRVVEVELHLTKRFMHQLS